MFSGRADGSVTYRKKVLASAARSEKARKKEQREIIFRQSALGNTACQSKKSQILKDEKSTKLVKLQHNSVVDATKKYHSAYFEVQKARAYGGQVLAKAENIASIAKKEMDSALKNERQHQAHSISGR